MLDLKIGDMVQAGSVTGVVMEITDGLALIRTSSGSQFCYGVYGLKPAPKEEKPIIIESQLTIFP